jgi:hypothetical protein
MTMPWHVDYGPVVELARDPNMCPSCLNGDLVFSENRLYSFESCTGCDYEWWGLSEVQGEKNEN